MKQLEKVAVITYNLGGPNNLDAVKPFLFNLFNDKAIISLPQPFRKYLAKFISSKRENTAKEIYQAIGGKSPILAETLKQNQALEKHLLKTKKANFKVFNFMRYWHPFPSETLVEVKNFDPEQIILLPLYPQFSTTTTKSAIKAWADCCKLNKLSYKTHNICCYPDHRDFIAAHCDLINKSLRKHKLKKYRILFSAHGLPEKIIQKGDPYQWQIEFTVKNIIQKLNIKNLDYKICYQSKVGPMKWLEPNTESEVQLAAEEDTPLIIVPIAFVSEHSETLYELDIEYKNIAEKHNLKNYIRVPALSNHPDYIKCLANLCLEKLQTDKSALHEKTIICPNKFCQCYNTADRP